MHLVKALARMVHTILHDGGTTDTLLYAYKRNNKWEYFQSAEMIMVVCTTTKHLKLHHQRIDNDLVGSHSLRGGGAMALKLHSYYDTTIKTFGRWTSLIFIQYIHKQISYLSNYV